MVRYWCSLSESHPIVFDNEKQISFCMSCDYSRVQNSFKDFSNYNPGAMQVTLPLLAIWIDKFKDSLYYNLRSDKIKEIAKYLLINTDSV